MQTQLATPRLTLRPLAAEDEADVIAGVGDIAVSGWLSVVPHPYGAADFKTFLSDYARPGETYVVADSVGFCGVVGIEVGVLGYWFTPAQHGKGYATEAARRVLAEWFGDRDTPVPSGYFAGNTQSANVLRKLGFVEAGRGRKYCRAMGCERDHVDMIITREAFVAAIPFEIQSDRLAYRRIFPTDCDVMHAMISHWEVTRQLGPKWPWPPERVFTMTRSQGFLGNGFVWGVFRESVFIGTIGITDGELGYMLHPDHQGQGLMNEAGRTAIAHAFETQGVEAVKAGIWADNAASRAVLHRLGFEETGETLGTSIARPDPSPGYDFILTRERWDALRNSRQ
jgi:RimJ/RimL family protein N-acetyltransferase